MKGIHLYRHLPFPIQATLVAVDGSTDGSVAPDAQDGDEEPQTGDTGTHHLLLDEGLDVGTHSLAVQVNGFLLGKLVAASAIAVEVGAQDLVAGLHASAGGAFTAGSLVGVRPRQGTRGYAQVGVEPFRGGTGRQDGEHRGVEKVGVAEVAGRCDQGERKGRGRGGGQGAKLAAGRGRKGVEGGCGVFG